MPEQLIIPFASNLVRLDVTNQLLMTADTTHNVSKLQFLVLEPLASNLDEIVCNDELIDRTKPGLITPHERFNQRQRVDKYIRSLRAVFDTLVPGLGDPCMGALHNQYGTGYWLSADWQA